MNLRIILLVLKIGARIKIIHNKNIKFAPCGRLTLRAVYIERYRLAWGFMKIVKLATLIFAIAYLSIGCSDHQKVLTPEMERDAKAAVVKYLKNNNLPVENIVAVESMAQTKPDFGYLYTGGGRCIEFIVTCYGHDCTELQKYPYDEHGDECP